MADVANVGPNAQAVPVPRTAWDPDMLYIHLSRQIEDIKAHMGDLRTSDLLALQAAFAAADKAVQTAVVSQEKAVAAALSAAEKAVASTVAHTEDIRVLTDRYTQNHLNQLNDAARRTTEERSHFLSVEAYNAAHGPLVNDVADLKLSRERDRGRNAAAIAIVGFVFATITVALRFI